MDRSNVWDHGLNGHAHDLGLMMGRLMERSDTIIVQMQEHREDMGEVKERLASGAQQFQHHHLRISALEQRPPVSSPHPRELPLGMEKVILRLGTLTIALLTGALTGTLGKILEILQASLKIAETLK